MLEFSVLGPPGLNKGPKMLALQSNVHFLCTINEGHGKLKIASIVEVIEQLW